MARNRVFARRTLCPFSPLAQSVLVACWLSSCSSSWPSPRRLHRRAAPRSRSGSSPPSKGCTAAAATPPSTPCAPRSRISPMLPPAFCRSPWTTAPGPRKLPGRRKKCWSTHAWRRGRPLDAGTWRPPSPLSAPVPPSPGSPPTAWPGRSGLMAWCMLPPSWAVSRARKALSLAGWTEGWPRLDAREWAEIAGMPVRLDDEPATVGDNEAVFWMGSRRRRRRLPGPTACPGAHTATSLPSLCWGRRAKIRYSPNGCGRPRRALTKSTGQPGPTTAILSGPRTILINRLARISCIVLRLLLYKRQLRSARTHRHRPGLFNRINMTIKVFGLPLIDRLFDLVRYSLSIRSTQCVDDHRTSSRYDRHAVLKKEFERSCAS